VKGAPDPVGGATQGLALPPEVSGMGTVLRAVWPPIIAIACSGPILVVRHATEKNLSPLSVSLRAAGGVVVVLALTAGWVRQRDHIHAWFRLTQKQAAQSLSSPEGT